MESGRKLQLKKLRLKEMGQDKNKKRGRF